MFDIKIKWIIYISIAILCVSCNLEKPPLEFAPNPSIIEKALRFKIEQKQNSLSRQLRQKKPEFTLTRINVTKIEPRMMFNLPTYHLEGTYKIILPNKNDKKRLINNTFNLDLQRQSRGKTWRILMKTENKKSVKYSSYLID